MKIVDSHIHFWDLNNGYNDWVKATDLPALVTPEKLKAYAFVHIEAHSEIYDPLCEYDWLKQKFPEKNIKVIAFADFTLEIGEFEKRISRLAACDDIVGVRQIMSKTDKAGYSPFDKNIPNDLKAKLSTLKQHNLIFEAQMYPEQFLPLLNDINDSGVKMVIEHFGLPIFKGNNNLLDWQTFIKNISQNKNWYIKLSGFELNNDMADINKCLDFIFENVSDDKLCYGSNFPVSNQGDDDSWQNFLDSYINNDDIAKNVFNNVARRVYFDN